MYGSQARDQEAGHPSHHRSPIDPVLDSKLSTNPVVGIIRFLARGCDFCESLHQSEAIHAHAPGSRDHLALAQCARSGNGGAGKWWRTGTGAVLAGRGIHGTNYCTVPVQPQQDSRILTSHRHDSTLDFILANQPAAARCHWPLISA